MESVREICEKCKHSSKNNGGIVCKKECYMHTDNHLFEAVEEVKKSCESCARSYIVCGGLDCDFYKECSDYKLWMSKETVIEKNETIVTNSQGGKQSKIDTAFSLVPHDSLLAVARVMKQGSERYEKDNWRKLSADEIYDHLMEHLVKWHMTGNKEDLEHAITRAMMLYSVVDGK